jgi:hypothetical protein
VRLGDEDGFAVCGVLTRKSRLAHTDLAQFWPPV